MDIRQIGALIRDARKRARITQAALGMASGISRLTINQLENGELNDIGAKKLALILGVLNLEIAVRDASPLPTLDEISASRDQIRRSLRP